MVTNYPRQLAVAENRSAESLDGGVMRRLTSRLSQTLCGVMGHDAVLHFEGKRVMMRCTSCGHHTPGIEVGERGPQRRFEGDAKRHRMAGEPRFVLRKIA